MRECYYYTLYTNGLFRLLNPILHLCDLYCHYVDISGNGSADFALKTGPHEDADHLPVIYGSYSATTTSSSTAASDTTGGTNKNQRIASLTIALPLATNRILSTHSIMAPLLLGRILLIEPTQYREMYSPTTYKHAHKQRAICGHNDS
jgi:hypothetical protein